MNREIEDKIINSRILFIDNEINIEEANKLIINLLYLDSISHEDINLYINSPGGDLSAGLAIIDIINNIKSNVNTICLGRCYSMAAIILACGNKGKRAMLPNSEVMIHEVAITHMEGRTKDVLRIANMTKEKNEKILSVLAKNTNLTINNLKELTKTDYYMNAEEALEKGFIDKIIDNKKSNINPKIDSELYDL